MTGTFAPPELYDHEKRLQAMREAAPEMYEALIAARGIMYAGNTISDQIDAALAKARGEQP